MSEEEAKTETTEPKTEEKEESAERKEEKTEESPPTESNEKSEEADGAAGGSVPPPEPEPEPTPAPAPESSEENSEAKAEDRDALAQRLQRLALERQKVRYLSYPNLYFSQFSIRIYPNSNALNHNNHLRFIKTPYILLNKNNVNKKN